VAKGTALRNANDRDLAVYVKAAQAPEELPALVNWVRDLVAAAYPAMSADQIVATTNCVNVRFAGTGLDVDVVPVLYEGEPDDVGYLVSKDDGTKLRTSVRQHLDFIRSRKKAHSKHLAQLIRFTKWWAPAEARRRVQVQELHARAPGRDPRRARPLGLSAARLLHARRRCSRRLTAQKKAPTFTSKRI
jgi:hypothetical protein